MFVVPLSQCEKSRRRLLVHSTTLYDSNLLPRHEDSSHLRGTSQREVMKTINLILRHLNLFIAFGRGTLKIRQILGVVVKNDIL